MSTHGHDDHVEGSELSEMQIRVMALETILTEKGYVNPSALDAIIEHYESKVGPHVGARIIAKAWCDPQFRTALLDNATTAIAELGILSRVGGNLIVLENTAQLHNLVVCTLCSCYPVDVLGLPPAWYKSAAYRSRAVISPRAVLSELGVSLPEDVRVRVWDSTADTRFIVLPMRPHGTDGWKEDDLAGLVTRNSMIGGGLPAVPGRRGL